MQYFFNMTKVFPNPFRKLFQRNLTFFSDFSRNEYLKKLLGEIENNPPGKNQIKFEEPFVENEDH